MKKLRKVLRPAQLTYLTAFFLLIFGFSSFAQTNGLMPVVNIRATDPLASWAGDPGAFTVFRDGPTNATLNVFYWIAGSASNGVDYASIGNYVMIGWNATVADTDFHPIAPAERIVTDQVLSQPLARSLP